MQCYIIHTTGHYLAKVQKLKNLYYCNYMIKNKTNTYSICQL